MTEKDKNIYESSFLFSMPSFLGGVASVIDIGSTLTVYNSSPDENTADYRAQRSDWNAVGKDMKRALNEWEKAVS